MGKSTNGLGQFRGKVGSVVFRVNQGEQIVSAYQPVVRNPKSNLQTAQRNKLYLASQLSKLLSKEDLIGMNPTGSARDRRSMFVKNVIDNTTSVLDGDLFTSKIDYSLVRVSSGLDSMVSATIDSSNSRIAINFGAISEYDYNRIAVKVIQLSWGEKFPQGARKSSWLELPRYTELNNGVYQFEYEHIDGYESEVIFIVPVALNEGYRYSAERKTLVQLVNNGEIAITGEYQLNAAVLRWYSSVSLFNGGASVILPPSGEGDQVFDPNKPLFTNLNNAVSDDNGGNDGEDDGGDDDNGNTGGGNTGGGGNDGGFEG